MADLHIGDPLSDFKLIKQTLDRVRNTENLYCILNGDLMDAAIASSVGDQYGANLQPMEQLKRCVDLFGGIAHKILCVTPGNHEYRIYKQAGIDITALMCDQLKISDKYSPTAALLFVRFGRDAKHGRKESYSIYVTHGSGGGRKEGGKVNRLADLAAIVDADIYIHSHTHLPMVFREGYFRAERSNSAVYPVDKLFVNTCSYLDYGGYGERAGYKPSSKINPVIQLDGTQRKMTIAF